MTRAKQITWVLIVLTMTPLLAWGTGAKAMPIEHQAAATAPTVTGTPEGPTILVPDHVNVRLGPDMDYDLVGVLIAGQQAPAIGRSPGGDWIQIIYLGVPGDKGWVYAPYVTLNAGQSMLPIVPPPPTPTPRTTATIDPTLAAQFNFGDVVSTRLPTFTPAEPVIYPTMITLAENGGGGFPPILAILGLLVIGLFGTFVSILRQ